jgi:DNA modification methylase
MPPQAIIRHGNCLELIKTIPSGAVDLVWTSPEYWNIIDYGTPGDIGHSQSYDDYLRSLTELFGECIRVLRRNSGNLVINIMDVVQDGTTLRISDDFIRIIEQVYGWRLVQRIVWFVPNKTPAGGDRRFANKYEWVLHFGHPSLEYFFDKDAVRGKPPEGNVKKASLLGPDPGNVWGIAAQKGGAFENLHPAAFPQELTYRIIKAYSPVGGIVLDPFGGCGTTPVCACQLGRKAIAFELNEKHYNTIMMRLACLDQEVIKPELYE